MLIYIIHLNSINKYRLPKDVSGSYMLNDIDIDNKSRSLINISSAGGKWYFNSNEDVTVMFNGSDTDKIEVMPYQFYTLNYHNSEFIILYVFPGFISNYLLKEVNDNSSIVIGKANDCDFVYRNSKIADKQIKLDFQNGVWSLTNLDVKIPIYINGKREESDILSSFDSVFVMGLKITFVGNKVFIVGPIENIGMNNKFIESKFELTVATNPIKEISKEFYTMNDYFYKSPIFKKKYDEYRATITQPEAKEKNSGNNILSEMIPSLLMSLTSFVSLYFTISSYKRNTVGASADALASNKESLITGVIMCAVMLITGILWPLIENIAGKIRFRINAKMRVTNYKKYLDRKDKELEAVILEEKEVLSFNNISLKNCEEAIMTRNSNLFSRNIESDSFLRFLCGNGKVKSSIVLDYQRPDMIVQDDNLYDDIDKLVEKYKYIDNSAFTFTLKNQSLAVINPNGKYSNYLNAIILQLATLHDYSSLKFVVLTSSNSNLNHIKNLNHCWNNGRSFRYFATNLNEAENVSNELMRVINKINNAEKQSDIECYYLIISDCIENYKGLKIIDYVLKNKEDVSRNMVSLLMFTNKVNNIPTGCNYFINYADNECTLFNSEMNENNIVKFKPNCLDTTVNFYKSIEKLSNIPIKVSIDDTAVQSLPNKLGFLEMYGVGKIEQLNIVERWRNAPISSTLAAPIGVDANGNILSLDLHEKKHGPHGLIAGMTGSGKSEFIITYLLSLAINYSPDEVQFVLIDYKGGGLAGAFENRKTGIKLPHLVGTITNLDKSEMNRTLVSIKSELQRRQKVFNAAKEKLNTGTIDIYKYQMYVRDGSLDEPMSHLFIVCDEFAELKAQQPDFMDELVSAARIGRSLGIHLILATQKPSGVVDDQIWSNAKFKVCCKVQTADDSQEMIRRPDAAYIKEAGRFYLQIGYDEYFVLGQSGYSGVPYVPSEMVSTNTDNSLYFIDNNGDAYRNVSKKIETTQTTVDLGEELNNICKYIVDVAEVQGFSNRQLWLDNVPKRLFYGNLLKKYKNITETKLVIDPLIGEYDDPEHQSQGFVKLPLTGAGNTVILGVSGSGKNTLMSTSIFSTIIRHTSEEVNIYILDFGSEQFNNYKAAPHVGDVITINEKDKVNYFFYMIEAELNKRKKYYSDNGGDFINDVNNGSSIFPNIIVYIYGLEVLKEAFDELFEGLFVTLTRSCSKYGIEFVVSASSYEVISSTLDNNFKQFVLLQLADESDYEYLLGGSKIPAKNPGRGIILNNGVPVEFQVALICEESDKKNYLDSVFKELDRVMPFKALEVPSIPKKITLDTYLSEKTTLDDVPIGLNAMTAQTEHFDFSKKISLFSASDAANTIKFISKVSNLILNCENTNLIVLNAKKNNKYKLDERSKYYETDFEKIVNLLYDNCQKLNATPSEKNFVVLIIGYNALNNHLTKLKSTDESIHTLEELIMSSTNNNFKFILYENENGYSKLMNSGLSDLLDNTNGIWIGVEYDSQSAFDMIPMDYSESSINQSNELIVKVVDSEPVIIRYPTI